MLELRGNQAFCYVTETLAWWWLTLPTWTITDLLQFCVAELCWNPRKFDTALNLITLHFVGTQFNPFTSISCFSWWVGLGAAIIGNKTCSHMGFVGNFALIKTNWPCQTVIQCVVANLLSVRYHFHVFASICSSLLKPEFPLRNKKKWRLIICPLGCVISCCKFVKIW